MTNFVFYLHAIIVVQVRNTRAQKCCKLLIINVCEDLLNDHATFWNCQKINSLKISRFDRRNCWNCHLQIRVHLYNSWSFSWSFDAYLSCCVKMLTPLLSIIWPQNNNFPVGGQGGKMRNLQKDRRQEGGWGHL